MPDRAPLGPFRVNRVGFGAMQLPGPGVFGPTRDHEQAVAVVRRAVELGVDHIDTAQFYGPDVANELLREALYPFPGDLVLVSKVGARRDEKKAWLSADRPEELRSGIEDNLRTLGVEQLAAVNLRLMDAGHETGVSFDDQLGAVVQAREDGMIAGVGLSNVSREQLLHALDTTPIACVQNPLNVVDRASLPVLQECAARGIAFVPFFPLGSAFDPSKPVLSRCGCSLSRRTSCLSRAPPRWRTSTRTCASPRSSLTPRHWRRWIPRSSSYSSALFRPRKPLRFPAEGREMDACPSAGATAGCHCEETAVAKVRGLPRYAATRATVPAGALQSATGEIPAMVRSGEVSRSQTHQRRPCGPAQTSQPAHRPDHPTPHQPPSQLRRIQRVDHPSRRSGLSWKFKSLCSVIAARPAAGDTGKR